MKHSTKFLLAASTSVAALFVAAQGAQAQAPVPAAAAAPAAPTDTTLGEIIVTATKRSENVQKIPETIQVVTAAALTSQGINNPVQLQEILPSIKFVAAAQMVVQIRGLGTINLSPGVDSAVAYSEDGVYLSHPEAAMPLFFDMQRVETLLGPQGTLYGRNSNGGVINFITNDPNHVFGGYATLGYGNYNNITSEAGLNIPVNDQLALRFSGATADHDPYNKDGSYDQHVRAGRFKLLYTPTDKLKIVATVEGAEREEVGNTYGASCPPGITNVACTGVSYSPWSGLQPAAKGQYNRDYIFGASGRIDYDLDWSQLTSITGYRQYRFKAKTQAPWIGGANAFDFDDKENDKFITQEVRLASNPSSPIKWVGGVYYSHEEQPATQTFTYYNTLLQLFGLPKGYYQDLPIVASNYESEAAFGNVTIPLLFPGFDIRAGLRYTHETKASTGLVNLGIVGVSGTPFGPPQTNIGHEELWRTTWSAGADYNITPSNLLYVTAGDGFKSGGVNNIPSAVGLSTYAPETITSVEVGTKNRFLDNRLQINADYFHYDYRNYQSYQFYQPSAGPLVGSTLFPTVNSQVATFEGGEFDVNFKVTPDDTVGVTGAFLHNRFNKFILTLPYFPVINLSNTPVPLSPDTAFTLSYSHIFHMPNGDKVTVGGNEQIIGRQLVNGNYTNAGAGQPLYYNQAAYNKTNLTLAYDWAAQGVTFNFYVRNLENKAVVNNIAGGYPTTTDIALTHVMLDPPRTYGFSVTKRF